MWIVRLALSRPYTFVVLSLLILILSPFVILRTPIDLFPNIDIPVVAVGWTYTGLNVEEMEGRLTTVYERALTTLVDNIQHIESTTYDGLVVVKIYLQPNASIDTANAQVTAATKAQEAAVPFVDVVTPRPNAPDQDLVLPGNTLAYSDTPIYARTSGYLKRWYFGIGAQVHQGDLPALGSTRDTTMTETAHCTCGRSASP